MAKKKLYGNHTDPRCETCSFGKLSSDGSAVLCRHGGAVPKYHQCRRYRYDPLKRTPHRQQPMEPFSEADFSLDDPVIEVSVPATAADADTGTVHTDTLDRLRCYLNATDAPRVEDIMSILSQSDTTAHPADTVSPEEGASEDEIVPDGTPGIDADLHAINSLLKHHPDILMLDPTEDEEDEIQPLPSTDALLFLPDEDLLDTTTE